MLRCRHAGNRSASVSQCDANSCWSVIGPVWSHVTRSRFGADLQDVTEKNFKWTCRSDPSSGCFRSKSNDLRICARNQQTTLLDRKFFMLFWNPGSVPLYVSQSPHKAFDELMNTVNGGLGWPTMSCDVQKLKHRNITNEESSLFYRMRLITGKRPRWPSEQHWHRDRYVGG